MPVRHWLELHPPAEKRQVLGWHKCVRGFHMAMQRPSVPTNGATWQVTENFQLSSALDMRGFTLAAVSIPGFCRSHCFALFYLLVFLFNVISVWVILGQSIVQMILWERHSHQRSQLNYSAAKKPRYITHTMANAGAQLSLCNFYTTHYLSLDICCLNPKRNKWAFFSFLFSRLRMSTNAASHTLLLYLGCVVASPLPLCSAHLFSWATPLHFALTHAAVHPNPFYPTVRLLSTSAESRRQ